MPNTSPMDKPKVTESLLARIWKGQWVQKGPLPTSDGRMVRVRSPGIENKDSGPDFWGAAILLDDEIVNGDVELHVKSSDWRAHGHHRDPCFNQVILQVVLRDDAKKAAQLENGKLISTLPLHDYLNGSLDELSVRVQTAVAPPLPCRNAGNRLAPPQLEEILNRFGEERFYFKSASSSMNRRRFFTPESWGLWGMSTTRSHFKNWRAACPCRF